MLRNNRIFQSLGIGALVSMIRNSNNAVTEASAITTNDSTSAITQDSSSEYSPEDDGVIGQDESDDTVVKKQVKVGVVVGRGGLICVLFV